MVSIMVYTLLIMYVLSSIITLGSFTLLTTGFSQFVNTTVTKNVCKVSCGVMASVFLVACLLAIII